MEQKIEFLEIQLREINDREANLKNLNNSIMTAFNDISKERDVPNSVPKATVLFFIKIIENPQRNRNPQRPTYQGSFRNQEEI